MGGATTSVVLLTASGVTWVASKDVEIGSTTVPLLTITSATDNGVAINIDDGNRRRLDHKEWNQNEDRAAFEMDVHDSSHSTRRQLYLRTVDSKTGAITSSKLNNNNNNNYHMQDGRRRLTIIGIDVVVNITGVTAT